MSNTAPTNWQPISTLKIEGRHWFDKVLLAHFWQAHDEESGPPTTWHCGWVQVAGLLPGGWSLDMRGLDGVSGGHALLKLLQNATHWSPLPILEHKEAT